MRSWQQPLARLARRKREEYGEDKRIRHEHTAGGELEKRLRELNSGLGD